MDGGKIAILKRFELILCVLCFVAGGVAKGDKDGCRGVLGLRSGIGYQIGLWWDGLCESGVRC